MRLKCGQVQQHKGQSDCFILPASCTAPHPGATHHRIGTPRDQSHCQANPLALVDCVQDTYSNVAALIDDSVYNMAGGMEEDLEKMMMDLTRVDNRVTTIVAGVRSMSMTFKVRSSMVLTLSIPAGDFGRFSCVLVK